MNILAPYERQKWTTYHLVERVLALQQTGVPPHEIAESLESLGVSKPRITELLNGERRRC